MEERAYIVIADKADTCAIRRMLYIEAPTLKEAWRVAERTPVLKGWIIRNVQPATYGRKNGWYTITCRR